MKTYFIDIDAVIFKQKPGLTEAILEPMEVLPGVLSFFNDANWGNHKIILTTGRKESARDITIKQVHDAGLFFDVLLCGLDAGGVRVLINNLKKDSEEPTAIAINLKENEGLINVTI